MELFKLFGTIMIDDQNAVKTLQNFEKKGKETSKSTEKMNEAFSKIGKAIITAFSVTAIVSLGTKIVETTAQLQAMESQFEQVFKSDTETAMKNITEQSKELGIHTDRLTASWNKFGAQTKGAGMDAKQSLESTEKATMLAADAAAFYDVSLETSSASLASFMKGNFAAGDAIGVFTSAKQMDVKANDMYGKAWADLTEAERQYLLLDTVEKTYEMNGATGQAIRESKNWENVTANLKSTWDRFLFIIGGPVLSVATEAVVFITEKLGTLSEFVQNINIDFSAMKNWIEDNKTALEFAAIAIGTLTIAIIAYNIQSIIAGINSGIMTVQIMAMYASQWIATTATTALTIATSAFGAVMAFITSPITLVILAIGAVIAICVLLYKNWDKVSAFAKELFTNLSTTFKNIQESISEKVNSIIKTVTEVFSNIVAVMSNPFKAAGDVIKGVIDKIKGLLNFNWSFPKLKMPHFSVSGSANPLKWLSEGTPKINVDWYAKGGIFDKPTLFNTSTGLKGVGEAGAEAVIPIDNMYDNIKSIIANENKKNSNDGFTLNIENFENNRKQDIEDLMEEIAFFMKRKGLVT